MGEFDLDPSMEGAAGFGWEAHFRDAAPADGVRMAGDSGGCVYPCSPTWSTCGCPTRSQTCGASGRPCLC